jgi:hypothetical protein
MVDASCFHNIFAPLRAEYAQPGSGLGSATLARS